MLPREVNYIAEINAFERWLEHNYLPISSQLLWYKLMALCNRCGWSEWVQVDNQRLMAMMQQKREATFIGWRDALISKGLVEYKKGRKGFPNQYKINFFTFKTEVQSVAETVAETVVNMGVQSVAETVDITKQNKTKRDTPLKPPEGKKRKATVTETEEQEVVEQSGLPAIIKAQLSVWLRYKRERREGYTPTGLKALVTEIGNKAGEYGPEAVAGVMGQSMSNGWKGICWDKLGEKPRQTQQSAWAAPTSRALRPPQRKYTAEDLKHIGVNLLEGDQ